MKEQVAASAEGRTMRRYFPYAARKDTGEVIWQQLDFNRRRRERCYKCYEPCQEVDIIPVGSGRGVQKERGRIRKIQRETFSVYLI